MPPTVARPVASGAAAAAEPSFDDDLSFNTLTFEDDDDEGSSKGSSDEGPLGSPHDDSGYPERSPHPNRARGKRGKPQLGEENVTPTKVGSRPIPAPLQMSPSLTSSLSYKLGSLDMLSPTAASSPRVRSRPRSRSRSKHTKVATVEPKVKEHPDHATVVLVRNLLGGPAGSVHGTFKQTITERFAADIKDVILTVDDDFGFVETVSATAAKQVLMYCSTCQVAGAVLAAELCGAATPGRDPVMLAKYGEPTNTLVLKNLPFHAEQQTVAETINTTSGIGSPLDVVCRLNASGAFSGMAYVYYQKASQALQACKILDGATVLDRKIRVEFKRQDLPVRTRTQSTSSSKGWKSSLTNSYTSGHSLTGSFADRDRGDIHRASSTSKSPIGGSRPRSSSRSNSFGARYEPSSSGGRPRSTSNSRQPPKPLNPGSGGGTSSGGGRTRTLSNSRCPPKPVTAESSASGSLGTGRPRTSSHNIPKLVNPDGAGRPRTNSRQKPSVPSPEEYKPRPRSFTHTGATGAVTRMPKGPDGTRGFRSRADSRADSPNA